MILLHLHIIFYAQVFVVEEFCNVLFSRSGKNSRVKFTSIKKIESITQDRDSIPMYQAFSEEKIMNFLAVSNGIFETKTTNIRQMWIVSSASRSLVTQVSKITQHYPSTVMLLFLVGYTRILRNDGAAFLLQTLYLVSKISRKTSNIIRLCKLRFWKIFNN